MNIYRTIKKFIQRGRRGWADEDIWAFDSYLCDVVIGGLKHLKNNLYGCPSEFYDQDAKNNECHRWEEAIETMIQGFEAAKHLEGYYFKWEIQPDGHYKHVVDQMSVDNQIKKREEGLALFVKYFSNLWD